MYVRVYPGLAIARGVEAAYSTALAERSHVGDMSKAGTLVLVSTRVESFFWKRVIGSHRGRGGGGEWRREWRGEDNARTSEPSGCRSSDGHAAAYMSWCIPTRSIVVYL